MSVWIYNEIPFIISIQNLIFKKMVNNTNFIIHRSYFLKYYESETDFDHLLLSMFSLSC